MTSPTRSRQRQLAVIFLVSLAGLLLEVGYTRIVSYKLWYYYTYLVLGLALLGIGFCLRGGGNSTRFLGGFSGDPCSLGVGGTLCGSGLLGFELGTL